MYSVYTDKKNTTIVVSSYNGKTVRGVAKCHPNDEFNSEIGVVLAKLRCGYKIADKKYKAAVKQYEEIVKERAELDKRFTEACKRYQRHYQEKTQLKNKIENFFESNDND